MATALADRQRLDLPDDVEPIPAHPDELSRTDWLRLRRGGIGGSDASAIIGANDYTTPLAVWAEKTAERAGHDLPLDDDPGPDDPRWWGTMLEPVIAEAVATKLTVVDPKIMYWDHRFTTPRFYNVDRLVYDPELDRWVPLEIKTVGFWKRDDWANEGVPADHAFAQVVHGDLVVEAGHAWVAVLIAGQDFRLMRVSIDDQLATDIGTAEENWWDRYVEPLVAPPPLARDVDFIDELVERMEREVELPPEARDVWDRLVGAHEAGSEAERVKDQAKAELKKMLGDGTIGMCQGKKMCGFGADPATKEVSYTITADRQLDLAAAHPDIFKEYATPKPAGKRRFNINYKWAPQPTAT